jgi:hypothetical protein
MVRKATQTRYLPPVATQSFLGKKCEKRTITPVIQSYHSRCPKCPLEVTISQTEVLLCVSSRRRGWLVKILKLMLNYLGIVDDTGTLFDESGTV